MQAIRSNRLLASCALAAIVLGLMAWWSGWSGVAHGFWVGATCAALLPLMISIVRTLRKGRIGVDIIALLAMAGALLLEQYLTGAVIAVMYSGGRALEEFAESRAPHGAAV